jgi:hypothetical protein
MQRFAKMYVLVTCVIPMTGWVQFLSVCACLTTMVCEIHQSRSQMLRVTVGSNRLITCLVSYYGDYAMITVSGYLIN